MQPSPDSSGVLSIVRHVAETMLMAENQSWSIAILPSRLSIVVPGTDPRAILVRDRESEFADDALTMR
ncbi:MAG: hypothetical protein V5B32_13545 [Candidatus Accumulibacter sp. UW26]